MDFAVDVRLAEHFCFPGRKRICAPRRKRRSQPERNCCGAYGSEKLALFLKQDDERESILNASERVYTEVSSEV